MNLERVFRYAIDYLEVEIVDIEKGIEGVEEGNNEFLKGNYLNALKTKHRDMKTDLVELQKIHEEESWYDFYK